MLKMIIADDEAIIRETISNIIDWKAMGIEVVGLCRNGMEVYNMIQDENPDIIMTDIKMPGMDGLTLIEKTSETYPDIQFIILSGYGEFDFAKKAMKHGVKHYLLKPCNEDQIRESVLECKEECLRREMTDKAAEDASPLRDRISNSVVINAINDCVLKRSMDSEIIDAYATFLDFDSTPYRLLYVYYMPYEKLDELLHDLSGICGRILPGCTIHGVYVNNTLVLFYTNYDVDYTEFERHIENWKKGSLAASLETHAEIHPNLKSLFEKLVPSISRYATIYYISDFHTVYSCNYKAHVDDVQTLYQEMHDGDESAADRFAENIGAISDMNLLRQVISSMLLKLVLDSPESFSYKLTEWLGEIEHETDAGRIRELASEYISEIRDFHTGLSGESAMTRQVCKYVNNNLSDSDITLKYIAENILYMNVDYVSKKFLKEKGVRFSAYLTEQRMSRAKELLSREKDMSVQTIAEAVGLGNNPQYFSQLFKKTTGMTPSAYAHKI